MWADDNDVAIQMCETYTRIYIVNSLSLALVHTFKRMRDQQKKNNIDSYVVDTGTIA